LADADPIKHVVLDRIGISQESPDSSVYSDNPEDAAFMEHFARRYIVLNTTVAHRMWRVEPGRFHSIVNYEAPGSAPDIDSINERTVRWVYVPTLYYVISRFRRKGLCSVFSREIVPVTLAAWWFTSLGVRSFALVPLSFLMFFCVYEIGGLVNDLCAGRESPETRTRRISPDVRIHVGLFLFIRIVAVSLILACLPLAPPAKAVYAGLLGLCLAVYLLHTALVDHRRLFTVILLKWCRSCIPPTILLSLAPWTTVACLGMVFFLMDGPWRVYVYCRGRGMIRGRVPVRRIRAASVTVLSGLGVVIYLVTGSSLLLIIGSYYVLLECVHILVAVRPPNGPSPARPVEIRSTGERDFTPGSGV